MPPSLTINEKKKTLRLGSRRWRFFLFQSYPPDEEEDSVGSTWVTAGTNTRLRSSVCVCVAATFREERGGRGGLWWQMEVDSVLMAAARHKWRLKDGIRVRVCLFFVPR